MQLQQGQVAVITGGASGIGLGMAQHFAQRGLRLVLADIEQGALDRAVADLTAAGADVIGIRTDVSKVDQVEALAAAAFDRFGAVNVLCSNAGVVKRGVAWEQSLEDWEWVVGVDLWSVIYGARAFIPRMLASGEPAHLVNTASTAGLAAFPMIGSYNVSKAGVVALSETLWHDLRTRGAAIGVSVLCPGLVATRIGESDRNRPGATPSEPAAAPISMRNPGAVAMLPSEVAQQVADAIESDQFWIITHPVYDEFVRQRAAGILNRRDVIEPLPL